MKTLGICAALISVCFAGSLVDSVRIEKRIDKIEEYHAVYGLMEIHIKAVNGKITEGKIKRFCGSDRTGYDDLVLDISFARLLIDKVFEPKELEKMDSIRSTPWGTIQYVPDHMATDTRPGDK